jgi:hypothetical protein
VKPLGGRGSSPIPRFGVSDGRPNLPYKLSYTIESQAAAVAGIELIQAQPQDLALRLDEAGKAAKKTKDSTGTWTYARNALGGGSPAS